LPELSGAMADPGITLGLKFQARVLVPQVAEKDSSQWLVATNCLREENEVRVVQYDPATETVKSPAAYVHNSEVWDLAPCPERTDRFFTVHNSGGEYDVTLWEAPPDDQVLRSLSDLPGIDATIRRVLWHPKENGKVATIEEGKLKTWSLAEESVKALALLVSFSSCGVAAGVWGMTISCAQQVGTGFRFGI